LFGGKRNGALRVPSRSVIHGDCRRGDLTTGGNIMRVLGLTLSMAVVVILSGIVSAEKKGTTNKEKIVGSWKLVKTSTSDTKSVGGTIEFTKDGKYGATDKVGKAGAPGTYEVDGDKLKVKIKDTFGKGSEKEYTFTIKTITDKEMVLEKKMDDRTDTAEYTRVK
jgi:uncharacterized protein (TIGR03066 family)